MMNVTIVIYYTALLNAAERSVHLHGSFKTSSREYFFDNSPLLSIMTGVKESGFFAVCLITPQEVR